MELFGFDEGYVKRLQAGDPAVEQHFAAYFGDLLRIKLRARFLPPHLVEDLTQETFARVLGALRKGDGLRNPESLGAFVHAVCHNVLLEHHRNSQRESSLEDDNVSEPEDRRSDPDRTLLTTEAQVAVRQILARMPERDRLVLKELFLEEQNPEKLCRLLGVSRDYLRVIVHRAKGQFREAMEDKGDSGTNAGKMNAGKRKMFPVANDI